MLASRLLQVLIFSAGIASKGIEPHDASQYYSGQNHSKVYFLVFIGFFFSFLFLVFSADANDSIKFG